MQQPTVLSTSLRASVHWSEQPEEEEEQLLAALSTVSSSAYGGLKYSSFMQYWLSLELHKTL